MFAKEIVHEVNRLFPPSGQKGTTIPEKEFKKKFESLVARVCTFASKHELNVYKKAKLLNTIKWEMKEAGHEEAIIDEFIAFIIPLLGM